MFQAISCEIPSSKREEEVGGGWEEDGRDLRCADAILPSEKKLPSWHEQSWGREILTQICATFTRSIAGTHSHAHTHSHTCHFHTKVLF